MTNPTRMSPLTAFFLGLFGVGGLGIAGLTVVAVSSLKILDDKASAIVGLTEHTIDALPDLLAALPPALGDILSDRRAPDYAEKIDVSVRFTANEQGEGARPVLTVVNKGDEVVSMLAVRVVALDPKGVPVREWTEVVATPLAIDDEWRGTLLPGKTRYVVLRGSRAFDAAKLDSYTGAVEISEIRVWVPEDSWSPASQGL